MSTEHDIGYGWSHKQADGETEIEVVSVNTGVEPLNKGHFGANSFVPCREVVPISEVK